MWTSMEFETAWMRLKKTAEKIIKLEHVPRHRWNAGFSDVYNLSVLSSDKLDVKLYDKTQDFLEEHIKHLCRLIETSNEELTAAYYKYWTIFSQGLDYLNILYTILNNLCVRERMNQKHILLDRKNRAVMEIEQLGYQMWSKHIIEKLKIPLVHLLLQEIDLDRLDKCPKPFVIQGVIQSFIQVDKFHQDSLKTYRDLFEKPFLQHTDVYFKAELNRLLQEMDCSQYIEKVRQIFRDEELRSRRLLHSSSAMKVFEVCQKLMVKDQLQFLCGEWKGMIIEERRKDLKNMYHLLSPIRPASEVLEQELQQHITTKALEAIDTLGGTNVHKIFVENLTEVYAKYSNLIKTVFQGYPKFVVALDKAFVSVLNPGDSKIQRRSPELLVKYWDFLLKKNARIKTENEIESKLTQSMVIFKTIADKDVVLEFYARLLVKRLIKDQSISVEVEEAAIDKLKQECGFEYIRKIHRMFTDVKVSKGFGDAFIDYLGNENTKLGINFDIMVFQTGTWPFGKSGSPTFSIPQELELCVQKFENFYNSSFSGRKLTWLHNLSSGELKFCYLKKPYIVTMSTFQMAILLLFKEADEVSYSEILENTKLGEEELTKQIKTLLGFKLLSTSVRVKSIDSSSSFILNKNYSNKKTKFAINIIRQQTTQQEVQQTHNYVDEDRKHYLEAAIVRIMKDRKTLKHNDLIEEVIRQARNRFLPNICKIKKCIEVLIDKEYIERSPNCTNEYNYIA